MRITPGDVMTASVRQTSPGTWLISIADTTSGATFTRTIAYSGPGTSAEWVEEAPTVGSSQSSLADFGTVTFSSLTVNGANAALVSSEGGEMLSSAGAVVALPSAPGPTGNSFSDAFVGTPPPSVTTTTSAPTTTAPKPVTTTTVAKPTTTTVPKPITTTTVAKPTTTVAKATTTTVAKATTTTVPKPVTTTTVPKPVTTTTVARVTTTTRPTR